MIAALIARTTGRERAMVASLVAIGVAIRIAWNAIRATSGAAGEAMNVAAAIGTGRGVADAYGVGTGPTAHFYPLTPGIGGAVYAILGVRSLPAEALLATWSIGLAMLTYLLLFRAFARLGTPAPARIGALAFACMAPIYLGQEAVDFRLWDGGLTAMLMALLLDRAAALTTGQAAPIPTAIILAACCVCLFLVNAPVGVAAGLCALLLALRYFSVRQTTIMAVAGALLLALTVTPWALRNQQVLGAVVPLRSNAGLELAIGMDPASLDASDRHARFMQRLSDIHPSFPDGQRAMRAAGGEVAYSALLMTRTREWIAVHPGETVRLLFLHLRQQWLPETWQFAVFSKAMPPPPLRAILASAVNLLGIAGIAAALYRRRPGWIYPLILLGALSALTLPFQPATRYTYLYYPTLLFAAADLLSMLRRARRSRAP